jgi:very-short-patch-repair endonuclease
MNPYEAYYRSAVKESGNRRYEDHLLAQIKQTGLKIPEREFKFHDTRKWRFDFAFVESKVAVEVEGGIWSAGRHTRGAGFEGDCEKYNEAALAGWRVIRVSPKMVMDLRAIEFIKRALFHG